MNDAPQADVDQWLAAQGFAQYAALFAENAIDFELLPTLSEADLKSLGLPFGHARKLALAAAALARSVSPAEPPPAPSEAERRQLTVMFCDLVGSTALSSRLDPEDLRAIIRRYQKECAEIIAHYGGFIAQYLGDGILVYFGYPQAQEDAAERAVRSGLAIIAAVEALKVPGDNKIQVRLGAATGLAVVGDLIGRGSAEQEAVIGQTPNLAARIQSLAAPGCMTIAESTRKLVGNLFVYRDLGPQRLKGIEDEVRVSQVLGEQAHDGRFDLTRSGRLDCFGREHELEFLREKWGRVKAGQGQIVLAWGEAGIGKSRLLRQLNIEMQEELQSGAMTRIHVQCSPQHLSSAFYPIIRSNQRYIGLRPDDSSEQKIAKIEQFLAEFGFSAAMPLFASLMSVPLTDRYPELNLTPDEQKEQILRLCVDFVVSIAAQRPVLYQIEDIHWMDPSTHELLARLVESVPSHRILLLATSRPECKPEWLGRPGVAPIDLGRLAETEIRQMVSGVCGKPLPEPVVQQILAKTDGVPLFVEEFTRTLLESGLLRETGDAWVLDKPLPAMAIPLTLQDSLMARLDRLSSAKEVVQTAAAIGRAFPYPMLAAVLDYPEPMLRAALDRLNEAGLIFPRGEPPDSEYRFKHALVQDVAYESLLKTRRAVLHTRIVRVLESEFPDTVATQPELLAYHSARGDQVEKAVHYSLLAGQRALGRSANREALQLLGDAVALCERLPDTRQRDEHELALQLARGQAALAHYGYAAHETADVFARARELAERLGKAEQSFETLYGLYASNTINGRLNLAGELGQRFLGLASQLEHRAYQCIGHRMLGVVKVYRGQLAAARNDLESAIALYDPNEHRGLALRFGTDIGVTALNYLGWTDSIMGRPEAAIAHVDRAIEQARQSDHALSLAQSLHMRCFVQAAIRDYPALLASSEAALRYCEEKNLGYFLFWARNFKALAEAMLGLPDALLTLRTRLPELPDFNRSVAIWWFHAWVAEVLLALGNPAEAQAEIELAEALAAASNECWGVAELARLRAACLLAQGPANEIAAEGCLQHGIAQARQIGALTFELRAALELYRLLVDRGREPEAKNVLEALVTTAGADPGLPELAAARRLLAA